jgi:hypothetical protein
MFSVFEGLARSCMWSLRDHVCECFLFLLALVLGFELLNFVISLPW